MKIQFSILFFMLLLILNGNISFAADKKPTACSIIQSGDSFDNNELRLRIAACQSDTDIKKVKECLSSIKTDDLDHQRDAWVAIVAVLILASFIWGTMIIMR
jgi:hypothetical protein